MNIEDIVRRFTPDIDAPKYYYFGLQQVSDDRYTYFVVKRRFTENVDPLEMAESLAQENISVISCCRIQAHRRKAGKIIEEIESELNNCVGSIENEAAKRNRFFNCLITYNGDVNEAVKNLW